MSPLLRQPFNSPDSRYGPQNLQERFLITSLDGIVLRSILCPAVPFHNKDPLALSQPVRHNSKMQNYLKKAFIILFSIGMIFGVTFMESRSHAAEAKNIRLVGHNDLDGRDSLQVVLKGIYAYIGHHRGEAVNSLTGRVEPNGTTILNVKNPDRPQIVAHIPGFQGAESRAVQVAENFSDGKDYLLRNQESSQFTGFEVWDVTEKKTPRLISTIGPLEAAHKSWWDTKSGYAYLSGIMPGWRGQHLIIYDLRNPRLPRFVSSWGLPGQEPGAKEGRTVSLHHPVISGNRAYLSYLSGGDMVVLDISNKANPKMVSHLDFSPPFSGIHTTVPFNDLRVPNFTQGLGDVRNFLVVSEEAFAFNCRELRRQIYIVDATDETHPLPVAVFKVPDGDFCERGGRFGPHQFAETRDGEIIRGTLLFIAYFNAGLRVVDISDPYHPQEVGFFIPGSSNSLKSRGSRIIQTNDVDLDHRGLIYITDREGHGLHILDYLEKKE